MAKEIGKNKAEIPEAPEAQPDSEAAAEAEAEGFEEENRSENGRTSRVLRMARRLMDRKELAEDTRELLVSVLATSDKAKTEAVRMVAREVRSYLEAMELKEELLDLVTSYSLDISIRLKPLADAVREEEAAASEKKKGSS